MSKQTRFTWRPGDIEWKKPSDPAPKKQTSAQKLADQVKKAKDGRSAE